jgi:hypothetical protein
MQGRVFAFLSLALSACATVHQEDLDAWQGQPVSALDVHPVFLTMQLVKTVTPDGTEIRNYVNGGMASQCTGGGGGIATTNGSAFGNRTMVSGQAMTFADYNSFSSCMQRRAACNNIFYIKDGVVQHFTPIGSGGMRCMTTAELRPGFMGAANIR